MLWWYLGCEMNHKWIKNCQCCLTTGERYSIVAIAEGAYQEDTGAPPIPKDDRNEWGGWGATKNTSVQ